MKTTGTSWTPRGLATLLSVAASLTCTAQTPNTWTGNGDDWNEAANWSDGLPVAGQDIVIDGDVTLTNATPRFASYTLNANRTHTFDGWDTVLNAAAVTIKARATMTHAQNDATTTNSLGLWVPNARVNIECATLAIEANGKIDVNGMGYLGSLVQGVDGCGPGFGSDIGLSGVNVGKSHATGASHGGLGSRGVHSFNASPLPSPVYGDPYVPEEPGSGGARGAGPRGGNGGGVVRIIATGNVSLVGNATITANGKYRGATYCGGGSGGSVYIVCETIIGNGSIMANGERGQEYGGAGGGGRISIQYDPGAQAAIPLPGLSFSAAGHESAPNFTAQAGTLAMPDSQFLLRQDGVVRHSGQWMAPLARWERDSLVLENAWLSFPHEGFELIVTNNLTIKGNSSYQVHRLELTNGVVRCGGNLLVDRASLVLYSAESSGPELECGGNMVLQNNSAVRVYSAATEDIKDYGALVQVAGDLTVSSSSKIYPHSHPKFGGAVQFKVGSFTLDAGAGFDATGLGYAGGSKSGEDGHGPGGGKGATYSGGAGYGGAGGGYAGSTFAGYGLTNGLACAPFGPGSGGGGANQTIPFPLSSGGGAIRIESAGTVTVNGTMVTDGSVVRRPISGGSSGGAIFIICKTFEGTGILQANGSGTDNTFAGNGGGGRIAVWQKVPQQFWPNYFNGRLGGATVTDVPPETFTGTVSAAASAMGGLPLPEDGTIVFLTSPPLGTTLLVR